MFSGIFRIQLQRYGNNTILSTENKIIFKSQLLITKFTIAMAITKINGNYKMQ
jgi:hypothetical protein